MKAHNNFLIISLGQLTSASIWPSVSAFAQLSTEHSWFGCISYPYYWLNTAARYGWDLYVGGQIESYKLGLSKDHDFMNFLKSQFTSEASNDELTAAWNAMCLMGTKDTSNINSLMNFLNQNDVIAIIVSGTNPLQSDYIQGQISTKNNDFFDRLGDGKIMFSLSYKKGSLSMQTLAESALSNCISGRVYSLHRDVKKGSLSPDITFECDPFNPNNAPLSTHLVKAEEFFNKDIEL